MHLRSISLVPRRFPTTDRYPFALDVLRQEGVQPFVCVEQGLDLGMEVSVVAAGLLDQRRAVFRSRLQRPVEDLVDAVGVDAAQDAISR